MGGNWFLPVPGVGRFQGALKRFEISLFGRRLDS